jgi:hypothetical protein
MTINWVVIGLLLALGIGCSAQNYKDYSYSGKVLVKTNQFAPICLEIIDGHNLQLPYYCFHDDFLLSDKKVTLINIFCGGPNGYKTMDFISFITDNKETVVQYSVLDYPSDGIDDLLLFRIRNKTKDYDYPFVNIGHWIDVYVHETYFNTEEACSKLKSQNYSIECILSIQWGKDQKFLDSINEQFNKNISLCYEVKTVQLRDSCIRRVAHNLLEPELCEKIVDPNEKYEVCLAGMYDGIKPRTKEAGLDACHRIDPSYERIKPSRVTCLDNLALDLNDSSICYEIDNKVWQKMCLESVKRGY